MAKMHHTTLDEVIPHFNTLEDPRSPVNRKHPLVSVVVIALMGVLAGAGGPTAIARWAKTKEEFLLGVLDLPEGIPCMAQVRCSSSSVSTVSSWPMNRSRKSVNWSASPSRSKSVAIKLPM